MIYGFEKISIEYRIMQISTDAEKIVSKIAPLAPKGYAVGLHIRFSTPTFMLQAYDKKWTEMYTANDYIMSDPTVHWGFANVGACRWSNFSLPDPQDVLGKSAEHGLKYGITVACDIGDSRSIASFARGDREFTDDEIMQIEALVHELHRETAKALG